MIAGALAAARAAAGAVPPATHAEAKARALEVLRLRDYQTIFPDASARFRPVHFGWLDPAMGTIVLVVLAAAALFALGAAAFAVVGLLRRRRAAAAPQAAVIEPEPARPEAGAPRRDPALGDADRLADAGDFREALHVLLLVAIAAGARRAASPLPPSATSRELRSLLPLTEALRDRFAALVAAVERSLFGERPVDAGDYAACRARCEEILAGRTA